MSGEAQAVLSGQQRRGRPFQKGVSGNPGGRRPTGWREVQEKLKKIEPDAIRALKEAINHRPIGPVNVQAALGLLDRTMGRPPVRVDANLEVRVGMTDEMRECFQRARRMVIERVAEVIEDHEREESSG